MRDLLDGAVEELRYEPIERRVRGVRGGETVVDSTRAMLVWEPRRVCPSFAVPEADIRVPLAPAASSDDEVDGVLHPGIPFAVHTAEGEPVAGGLGFRLQDIAGYVALDLDGFDEWYEEDERIFGHPRDPYHRVDVRLSSRPLRIELDGRVLAETTRARMAYETRLMTRFYLPREDVLVPLAPSARRTYCRTRARRPTGRPTATRTCCGATRTRSRTRPRSPAWWPSGTSASMSSWTACAASAPAGRSRLRWPTSSASNYSVSSTSTSTSTSTSASM